jgi:hypothetical protein
MHFDWVSFRSRDYYGTHLVHCFFFSELMWTQVIVLRFITGHNLVLQCRTHRPCRLAIFLFFVCLGEKGCFRGAGDPCSYVESAICEF